MHIVVESLGHARVEHLLSVGSRRRVTGARTLDLHLGLCAVKPMDVALVVIIGRAAAKWASRLHRAYVLDTLLFHKRLEQSRIIDIVHERRESDQVGVIVTRHDGGDFRLGVGRNGGVWCGKQGLVI